MVASTALSIAEVSTHTGVSQAALRMWEKRYGWPKPARNESGYRVYEPELVSDIKRLAALIGKGFSVGDIIRDGALYWPNALAEKPERRLYDFTGIPEPRTSEGKRVRAKLEGALIAGDNGVVAWAQAQLPLLHPMDRHLAVEELLKLAGHR